MLDVCILGAHDTFFYKVGHPKNKETYMYDFTKKD